MIGSGNVATVLCRLMNKNGLHISQVVSRNIEHAKHLAEELGASFIDMDGEIDSRADLYIISVSDDAIIKCATLLKNINKPIVHTAGAVSKESLKEFASQYGILYPLQSIRKETTLIPEMPILIDGNNDAMIQMLFEFAGKISTQVQLANDETRKKLHVAAVFVNNFTNHLYSIAEDFCKKEQVDFNLLKPLILETASRLKSTSPKELQTGPAKRNDIQTIANHLELLSAHPQIKDLYEILTNSIIHYQR
jgi:predicted short-subunit dehydrogenase-like oxidoreductase (DUF2520 family)